MPWMTTTMITRKNREWVRGPSCKKVHRRPLFCPWERGLGVSSHPSTVSHTSWNCSGALCYPYILSSRFSSNLVRRPIAPLKTLAAAWSLRFKLPQVLSDNHELAAQSYLWIYESNSELVKDSSKESWSQGNLKVATNLWKGRKELRRRKFEDQPLQIISLIGSSRYMQVLCCYSISIAL